MRLGGSDDKIDSIWEWSDGTPWANESVPSCKDVSNKIQKNAKIGVHINHQVEKTETVSLHTNHDDGSLKTAWRDCPTGVNSHQQDWRVQKGALGVLQTSHFQRLNCGSPK